MNQTLSAEPPCELPNIHDMVPGSLQPPQEPSTFNDGVMPPTDNNLSIDSQGLLVSIISNKTVQEATGLDRQTLLQRFTISWSAESAFKNCTYLPTFAVSELILYNL